MGKPIIGAFQTILSKDERMMELAKKSFNSYLAFYYFHGNQAYMDPNVLDKDDLARMFGLMHTPKYKKFLKKCKSHKLCQMPNELKMLLLDNKKKKQQKSDLIKMMATAKEEEKNGEEDEAVYDDRFENEGAPKWFTETFKDKKDETETKQEEEDGDGDEDVDVDNWLESESEQDAEEGNEDDDLNED